MAEDKKETPWVKEAERRIREKMEKKGLKGIRFFAMESPDISEDDIARCHCLFDDAIAQGKVRNVTGMRL